MTHPSRMVIPVTLQFFETLHLLGRSVGRGPIHHRRTTVFEVTRSHGSVLGQFRAKPGRWVLSIETDQFVCANCGRDTSKFLQFMALENGSSVVGECVSNEFLDEHHKFTPDQEDVLRSLGWNEPLPPQDPNWFFEATSDVHIVALVELTDRTLREVLGLRDRDVVEIAFYEMAVGAPELAPSEEVSG